MSWYGIVKNYESKYIKDISIPFSVEAYINPKILKKILDTLSLDHQKGITDSDNINSFEKIEACRDGETLRMSNIEELTNVLSLNKVFSTQFMFCISEYIFCRPDINLSKKANF